MFDLLVRMGYKEIEVGFPSSGETDFAFVRSIIEEGAIPEDVTISVLTQAREELIERTVESLRRRPPRHRAPVQRHRAHLPPGRLPRLEGRQVKQIAVDGTRLVMEYAEKILGPETIFGYQYSPEIFTDTELDFALEVCEAVCDVWQPEAGPRDHPQPARHRGAFDAVHARGPLRVDVAQPVAPRVRLPVRPPAQRPRHRRRRRRAGDHGRRGPDRGLPVRPGRAHRQRRPGDAGHEPVLAGRRPADRLLADRRDPPHQRVLQPDGDPPAPPLRGRPGLHRLLRLPPGRHQEGLRRHGGRRGRPGQDGRRDRVGRAVSADRPQGRRPLLRGGHPGQLAVRQGRYRVRPEERPQAGPAAPDADRVLEDHPGEDGRRGRRGHAEGRSGRSSRTSTCPTRTTRGAVSSCAPARPPPTRTASTR